MDRPVDGRRGNFPKSLAVEYGLPLVNSTNGGISAIIDNQGRILARSINNLPKSFGATACLAALVGGYIRQTALGLVFGKFQLAYRLESPGKPLPPKPRECN